MARSVKQNQKWVAVPLLATLLLAGCFGKKKSARQQPGSSAEPDKMLYERALEDIRHGRHTVGRLSLQTLINTYPDSEYLAKAKLAIADSYYKEGGTAGLTQAVQEYNDFITFFPFLEEAAYAQMQIGMAHFRRMEKPDRDRTQGRLGEDAFQHFIEKYPNSPLLPQAEQRLREVQEVLAEGDYRIARFYYVKGSMRAAGARLLELSNRYPLYSQADKANWMLGNIFERGEKNDLAAQYYARIVRDYPLSNLAEDAKSKLTKLGVPVPQPSAEALARMQREREAERQRPGILRRSLGIIRSGPDVSAAARTGTPTMTPPSETATETLTPGGKSTVGVAGADGSTGGNIAVVEAISPGSPNSSPAPSSSTSASAAVTPPPAPGAATPGSVDPSPSVTKPEAADSSNPSANGKNDKKDDKNKKESSSKKKKGFRRIIPF